MEKSETNYDLFIQHVFEPAIVEFIYQRRNIINEWYRYATVRLIKDVKDKKLTLEEFIEIYDSHKKDWDNFNNGGIVINVLRRD